MTLNNRGTIALLLAIGVFGAGSVAWLQPADAKPEAKNPAPVPTVYALVQLPREDSLVPDAAKSRDKSDKAFELAKRNELTLVKSRGVLMAALRTDRVRALEIVKKQPSPTEWLEMLLEVGFPNDGDILRVGMTGSNPEEMAIVVNAVVDVYVQKREEDAKKQWAYRLDALASVCEKMEDKIRSQFLTLRRLSETFRTGEDDKKQLLLPLFQQSLQDCNRELRRVRLERAGLQVQLAGKAAKSGPKGSLEEQLAILKAQEELLAEEKNETLKKVERLSLGSYDVEVRQQQIDVQRQLLRRLEEEKARLKVDAALRPNRARIVQEAKAPNSK